MPWRTTCPMDERVQFIREWQSHEEAMTVLCRRYGISRKTGYQLVARYDHEGLRGLQERSRAPHHQALAVTAEVAQGGADGARETSAVGPAQTAGVAPATRRGDPLAGGQHHRWAAAAARAHHRPPTAAAGGAGHAAVTRGRGTERCVERGLQGLVPHGRWGAVYALDAHRQRQPVSPALSSRG